MGFFKTIKSFFIEETEVKKKTIAAKPQKTPIKKEKEVSKQNKEKNEISEKPIIKNKNSLKENKQRLIAIYEDYKRIEKMGETNRYKLNEERILEMMKREINPNNEIKIMLGFLREYLSFNSSEINEIKKQTGLDGLKLEYMASLLDKSYKKIEEVEKTGLKEDNKYKVKTKGPIIKLEKRIFENLLEKTSRKLKELTTEEGGKIRERGGIMERDLIDVYISIRTEQEELYRQIGGKIEDTQTRDYQTFIKTMIAGKYITGFKIMENKERIVMLTKTFTDKITGVENE
jgi:hypothetical protein